MQPFSWHDSVSEQLGRSFSTLPNTRRMAAGVSFWQIGMPSDLSCNVHRSIDNLLGDPCTVQAPGR